MIWYILLGILGVLVLLLCIPVFIRIVYRTGEPAQAVLKWFVLTFDLQKLTEEKPSAPKGKKKPKPEEPPEPKSKPKEKEPMEFSQMMGMILDLLSSAKGGVGMIVRHFRLYRIALKLTVAEEDAAETAIAYGKINAAVYGSLAFAKGFLNMAQPDIEIRPDFTARKGSVAFELRGRLLPIVAIGAAIRIGFVFLVKTIKRKNTNETGKIKEEAL